MLKSTNMLSLLVTAAHASANPKTVQKPAAKPVFDSVVTLDAAGAYAEADIKLKAVAAVHEWVETDSTEDGETYADRLMALMVGIADVNKDGELTDDEQDVVSIALEAAYDYLVGKGVAEDDATALLNDWPADVADRVRELLATAMPEGEDAASDEVDSFVFGAGDQEPAFDAVYKMKMAIRGGKKVRIKKRISGHVRLSARQKVAVAKMQRRSHSGAAMARRMKSARIGRRMGL
jgi:hypothetical protein